MLDSNILISLILLPLLGALTLLFFSNEVNSQAIKVTALSTSLITWLLSLWLWISFDRSTAKFQFVSGFEMLPLWNIEFYIGLDGISIFFVILTTFLTPFCVLTGWFTIKRYLKEYMIAFLAMEAMLITVFCVLDLLLFYIFFESVLIPMFIIIGVWGSRERKIHAAYQFFLYTLFGSVLMLLGIIIIYFEVGTTDYQTLLNYTFSEERQILLWLAFFASFAIKVPMIPVHIWLPEAHVEAPTAGSVILAGMLLKLGTYGFIRFSLPLFPYACVYFTPFIYALSVVAVIYTSLTTLRQIDMKKIIAYSSVAHMNMVTIGMFTFNIQGLEGSILLMLSHGLVSSALFLCIGVLYDRYHTRLIPYYGGAVQLLPLFSIVFLFFTLANMSMPGTSSFVGELLILVGIFQDNIVIAFLASTAIILGAAYSIWLYNRVVFGPVRESLFNTVAIDLTRREFYIFVPFIAGTILMGVYPELFLDVIHASTTHLLGRFTGL